jgi:multisubunit Na+/H+ antiporter MnhC subunit
MFKQRISAVYAAIINTRMLSWLAISLALTAAIYLVAPHQLQVTLYKLSLITTAAWLGYWIDRSLFPYARPDKIYDDTFNANEMNLASLRRAIIIAACVIGAALGA